MAFTKRPDRLENNAELDLMAFGPLLDVHGDEHHALKALYASDAALRKVVNRRAWPRVPFVVNRYCPLVQADFPEWATHNDAELGPLYEQWRAGRALSDGDVRAGGYR